MAAPLTVSAYLAALRAEGVRFRAHPGWDRHYRDDETGYTFGPVYGVVMHWTAGLRTPLSIIWDGNGIVPGPLAQTHQEIGEPLTLSGWRRCNHAGRGDMDVLAALEADRPPPSPTSDDVDFNDFTYSCEINGQPGHTWTYAEIEPSVRWAAAICRAHDWTEHSVIGHGELTRRKPLDPTGLALGRPVKVTMDIIRGWVADRLRHSPGWSPGSTDLPPPDVTPTPAEDDPMAVRTDAELTALFQAAVRTVVDREPLVSLDADPRTKKWPLAYAAGRWGPLRALQAAQSGARLEAVLVSQGLAITALSALVAEQNGLTLDQIREVVAEEIRRGIDVTIDVQTGPESTEVATVAPALVDPANTGSAP